jgi:hypothetical protein
MAEIEIRGGADDLMAAAVVAVVQRLIEEEAASRASRPRAPRPSAWVRATWSPDPNDAYPEVIPDQGHGDRPDWRLR